MGFRIDVSPSPAGIVLELAGDLTGEYVGLLLDECRTHGRPCSLSLAGLISADENGVAALRLLHAFGVEIVGASPYFRFLLVTP